MPIYERDYQGRASTKEKKDHAMRVTKYEKELILSLRDIIKRCEEEHV